EACRRADRAPARRSSRERPRFGFELLVGGALLAEQLEDEAPELAARGGELVGHDGGRAAGCLRERRVGRARVGVVGEVVLFEERVPRRAPAGVALFAQTARGGGEQRAQPFAV